jgi:hypothetical protein
LINWEKFSLERFIRIFGPSYSKNKIWIQVYKWKDWYYHYNSNVAWESPKIKENKKKMNNILVGPNWELADMTDEENREIHKILFWTEYKIK